jgi:tRNA uridine 5-carbamoylmethylation protein Kti12
MTQTQKKLRVVLTKGLPGCGKSTWAKKLVDESAATWKRVNKDDLRAMIDNSYWTKSNEKFVMQVRNYIIMESLKAGLNVVVDDTNFGPHFADISLMVGDLAKVEIQDFTDVPLQTCIERDLKRVNSVGKDVIMRMYHRFLNPSKANVFDAQPLPRNPKLADAIMCDLDGTISLLNGRNPYDASTCDKDVPNLAVVETIKAFILANPNITILFTSGRSDEYKTPTLAFLKGVGLEPNEENIRLIMRKKGDSRKDSEVKSEMFYTHISGRFNVLFVLDDRNQVVDKWRELGLTCFQVAPGDF